MLIKVTANLTLETIVDDNQFQEIAIIPSQH